MFDYNIFDSWLAANDVSDHTHELADAINVTSKALKALLPTEVTGKIDEAIRQTDRNAWEYAYGQEAADEHFEATRNMPAEDAFKATLEKVDNINLEIGLFAHNLYLYASAGMFEGEADRKDATAQAHEISRRINRAQSIVSLVPFEAASMDFFRLIAQGAVARWELDNDRPLTVDQVAALAALARGEGSTSTVLYLKVRKTIQNLVADSLSKGGKGTFEVDENRMISHASALKWLADHSPDYFPSMWMLPDEDADHEEDVPKDYVLVPVANPTRSTPMTQFTPSVVMPEGYVVGRKPEVFEDYWDALAYLQNIEHPRFRHPAVPSALPAPFCSDDWVRIPLSQIEAEITEMNISTAPALEGKTAEIVAHIDADSRFRPVAAGHSAKLHRYQSLRTGKAIAVERRKGDPVVYVTWSNGQKVEGLEAKSRQIGASPTGRNSNLNTIDNFKGTPLMAFRPSTVSEVEAVLDSLCDAD